MRARAMALVMLMGGTPVDGAAAQFEGALREAAANIPGAAAAVVTREGTWAGAVGVADLRTGRPMRTDTRLYVGSMSKPMTAAVALRLRAQGIVDVDQPLVRYLRGWRSGERIQLRHLLTHTAGIPREGGEYWFTADFPRTDDLRTLLRDATLAHEPGERWLYSNAGYAILGHALTVAANCSFEDLLERELFEPLSMQRSGARGPAPADLAMGYTAPHVDTGRGGRVFAGIGRRVGTRRERLYHDAQAMAPAFGMYSTATDMAQFLRALLQSGQGLEESVRRDMLERKHTFHDNPDVGWTYGLRIVRDERGVYYRHNGWFAAHRSHLSFRTEEGVGVVVLTNADDGDPEGIGRALMNRALLRAATP
ncbi:MAG: serine hydrolase domain-containing protein [Myxococcota bacterium]